MRNITLKVTALICAIVLWLYVVLQNEYTIQVKVPLKISGLAHNLALKDNLPDSIAIEITGQGVKLIQERKTLGQFKLDLSLLPIGQSKITLLPSFYHPTHEGVVGASILNEPSITIDLDTKIQQKFAVEAVVDIKTATGFTTYGPMTVTPDSIVLSGSRKLIRRLRQIQTEAIFLEQVKANVQMPVKMKLDFGESISSDHQEVQILQKVDTLVAQSFSDIPISLLRMDTSSSWSLTPPSAKLSLTGAKAIIDQVTPSDVQLFIDFNRFKIENTTSLAPNVKLMKEIKSWQVEPATFSLQKIEKKPSLDSLLKDSLDTKAGDPK